VGLSCRFITCHFTSSEGLCTLVVNPLPQSLRYRPWDGLPLRCESVESFGIFSVVVVYRR